LISQLTNPIVLPLTFKFNIRLLELDLKTHDTLPELVPLLNKFLNVAATPCVRLLDLVY